jgi:hypothetical protein
LRRRRCDIGDRKLGKQQRHHTAGHALGSQKGMEVAALRGWPAVRRMRMKKILRMACRIKHLPIGVMTPSANSRTPHDLAEEIGVPGGKVAPTIPDNLRRGYHVLDFGLADAQACVAVRIPHSTILARTKRVQNS